MYDLNSMSYYVMSLHWELKLYPGVGLVKREIKNKSGFTIFWLFKDHVAIPSSFQNEVNLECM